MTPTKKTAKPAKIPPTGAVVDPDVERDAIRIDPLKQNRITLRLIGTTALYYNAMSAKARRDLLLGGRRKTAADRREIRHASPENEFRESIYRMADGPTLLGFPAPALKSAMSSAAIETAGVTKTSVQKLVFLPEYRVRIWGRPYLKMDVVKSAGMNATPDIRTRAFLPRWCTEISLAYISPSLTARDVITLMANAGLIIGIGDYRQEKGRGNHGLFSVSGTNLGELQDVWDDITEEGREVQEAAMLNPEPADEDAAELLEVLREERQRRAT